MPACVQRKFINLAVACGVMIITVGGHPGSGKGTVGRLVASSLGYEYYSMGDVWRETARKHSLNLNEFHEFLKKNPAFDKEVEAYQQGLGTQDNVLLDSRLGYYCIPHALKVFLTVDPVVGATRIFNAHRPEEQFASVQQALEGTKLRAEQERAQYRALYHTDHYEERNYDLVIDTTALTPEQVAHTILRAVHHRQQSRPRAAA
jgi:predicted cytidylate kinase